MEHSERGRYVTDQVLLWIENDGTYIDTAKARARHTPEELRNYLTTVIFTAKAHTPPWQVAQELSSNDYDRVDWVGIKAALMDTD